MATAPRPLNPERIDIESLDGGDVITTQRGFKLKMVPIPAELLLSARKRVPMPKPPLRDDPEKPGQQFEVHGDPVYVQQMDEYSTVIKELSMKIMAAYGILAYGIPQGFYGPDDDEWANQIRDEAEIFSVDGKNYAPEIPGKDQPRARFYAWLRYHVLAEDDSQPVYDALIHGSGITLERDVDEAIDSFPGGEGRPTPNGSGKAPRNRERVTP